MKFVVVWDYERVLETLGGSNYFGNIKAQQISSKYPGNIGAGFSKHVSLKHKGSLEKIQVKQTQRDVSKIFEIYDQKK